MEVKKSPKADLEGKKTTWLLVGFVLILAAMFVAFEWTERDKQVTTDTGITEPIFEEEMMPTGRCALLVGKKILGRPDCINSRIVRGSREVEQDTASNTPAQKAAAVMWDLRYLFIIQLFISCFNR